MKRAIAARSFMRSDRKEHVRSGAVIHGADAYIDELARLRLVRDVQVVEGQEDEDPPLSPQSPADTAVPSEAAGEEAQSYASPAAQASPQTTATSSELGGHKPKKKKKSAPSL